MKKNQIQWKILSSIILKIKDFCKYLYLETISVFIATNRFKSVSGHEIEYKNIWKKRDTHLRNMTGFEKFNFIKNKKTELFKPYASHSI